MIMQIIMGFVSTICFSIIFNVPRKELFFCGLTGAMGWGVYQFMLLYGNTPAISALFSTAIITILSRIFAIRRKMPITVFLIAGIIPLVPGAGIYYTMYDLFMNELDDAAVKGIGALKMAGVISLGIVLVLSLPISLFNGKIIQSLRSRNTQKSE